jgi:hypothetical protein
MVKYTRTQFVRLKYSGTFKMDVGQPGLPVEAAKHYVVDSPSSTMVITANVAPLLTITARDKFYQATGLCWSSYSRLSLWPIRARLAWTRARRRCGFKKYAGSRMPR